MDGAALLLDLVVTALRRVLKAHPGSMPVFFALRTPDYGSVIIQAGDEYSVDVSPPLLGELEKILGAERIGLN